MKENSKQARTERAQWFNDARFGMFIHWGLYAIPAKGEWYMNNREIPFDTYKAYADEFDTKNYDPKEWARLAKKAGMKYAVLTAKHHDGFCLFDSKLTDYKSTNALCSRDLVAEFLEAFRAEGIRVGLYYSLIDWRHPDYPHYGDLIHPMRNSKEHGNEKRDFNRYLEYMHGQIRELLTNYGKLDIMWFDFSYLDMNGEKWKATELMEMVRAIQPHILIDNRLEGSGEKSGTILTRSPSVYSGDFASPEQIIPPACIVNEDGEPVPWEACITLNNNWGYVAEDIHYKSSGMVIRALVECVSKNGNLLLNVGPDATGRIPEPSQKILEEVGEWMDINSESIYGCGMAPLNKPEWGRYTMKQNTLYAHVMEEQTGGIGLEGLSKKIESIHRVFDGSEISVSDYWNQKEFTDYVYFHLNAATFDSYPLPDPNDTVVRIKIKNKERPDRNV